MDSTFMVILKVHGSGIALRSYDDLPNGICKANSFKLFCQDLDGRNENHAQDIQVFVIDELGSSTDTGKFQPQQLPGFAVSPSELVIFMTSPVSISRKVSYGIDIVINRTGSSLEDLREEICQKIGTAYLYLDPKYSTQGVQRMQVMGTRTSAPIGHIQVEYLIVKDPTAYGIKVPRPDWLSRISQLDAGHRGAGSGCRADLPGSITENTVASFNYAARHGADMCELDVLCTADGVPVVYHNYTLDTNSSDSIQIDQLTLSELRNVKSSIHDKDCKHKITSETGTNQIQNCTEQFPTLAEVLRDVDKKCGLNIEFKWPQLLPNGKSEANHYREINDSVDRILKCIHENENGRAIVLSTLNADIAILLRLKQSKYPVLFLTTGDCKRFKDPTTKSVKNAIHFAQAFDMAGINPNAAYLNEYLVKYAQSRGLLVYAWGKIESAQAVKELRKTGINGVIYDKIDLIKPQD